MVPACFPIVSNPSLSTGNWDHRVVASYGQDPIPTPEPNVVWISSLEGAKNAGQRVPPGPTGGHSGATGGYFYPTFSKVFPNLPRNAPWAGWIRWVAPPPEANYVIPGVGRPTPQIPNNSVTKVPYKGAVVRGGYTQGRVTTQPKPTSPWKMKVQGLLGRMAQQ
jgi:hypothetical protein